MGDLDKAFPIEGPLVETRSVQVFGKDELVEVHKEKGPRMLNEDGSMSWMRPLDNNISCVGSEGGVTIDPVRKPFRYMSRTEQSIMVEMAAKKNVKRREWLEHMDSQPNTRMKEEVPDFLKSIYKDKRLFMQRRSCRDRGQGL